jgi:outer membrane usher protein
MTRRELIAVAAVGLVLGASSVSAQTPASGAATQASADAPQPAVCRLVINGDDRGDVVIAWSPRDVWVEPSALTKAGLRWTSAETHVTADGTLVSVRSMLPAMPYSFDPVDVRLTIQAPAEAYSTQVVDAAAAERPTRTHTPSAFVNYSATASSDVGASYASEIGVSAGAAFLHATTSTSMGRTIRGVTSATIDDEHRLVRWELGDVFASTSDSSGVVPIMGVSVGRDFGISPTFVHTAPLALSGATAVPAVAEVYVNGQLVTRTAVAPGAFTLRDVPVPTGAGTVRLVIRDEFGRSTEVATSVYRSPRVLRAGLREFHYSVGSPRVDSLTRLFGYHGVVGLAEERYGLTSHVTIGGLAEASGGVANAGGSVAVSLPVGAIEVGAGASRTDAGDGHAWSLAYSYVTRPFSVQASARGMSTRFDEIGALPPALATRFDAQFSASTVIGHGLSLVATAGHTRDGQGLLREQFGLSTSASVGRRASLQVGAIATRDLRGRGVAAIATLTTPLGRRTSSSSNVQVGQGQPSSVSTSVQRSPSPGPDVGYQMQWRDAGTTDAFGDFTAQGSAGRVELRHDEAGGGRATSATVSGAIAFVGGAFHVSRPIDDAFALVRVGHVEGVRTYVSNQYVGRTGRGGEILVPSLLSYYANRVAVSDKDVPMTYEIENTESLVAPGLRGGSVVSFAVHAVHLVAGRFVLPPVAPQDGPDAPAPVVTAEAPWTAGRERVSVASDGAFLFEQAEAGAHDVKVRSAGREFSCRLVVAPTADGFATQSAGDVSCRELPTRGSR